MPNSKRHWIKKGRILGKKSLFNFQWWSLYGVLTFLQKYCELFFFLKKNETSGSFYLKYTLQVLAVPERDRFTPNPMVFLWSRHPKASTGHCKPMSKWGMPLSSAEAQEAVSTVPAGTAISTRSSPGDTRPDFSVGTAAHSSCIPSIGQHLLAP